MVAYDHLPPRLPVSDPAERRRCGLELDVVDRPRDQPKPTRTGGSLPPQPNEVGASDVIAYLREHPDFLDRHPEALRLVRPPTRKTGDGVLDFQHFMLERLRSDVVRLEDEQ